MRSTLLLFILFFINSLSALSLGDKLLKGAVGDYVVTEQNRLCSLIRIHTLDGSKITIEEISFPYSSLPSDIPNWIKDKALGHTSWSLLQIDIKTNTLEKCFSFTKNAYLSFSENDSFFLKILHLPLDLIQDDERKRIGSPLKEGLDTRKIWNPELFFEGKKEASPEFTAYKLLYPKDGSPLSGKRIELFFNKSNELFPFPYWGQITDDSQASLKFRVVASGRNLFSPKKQPL
ncbi:MAG: hypothetical protein FJZ59_05525 [Chlamydiae bacterium]|jgi:hypothetical protein|nr:hypothetical protein [Chlamydiota bacterium]